MNDQNMNCHSDRSGLLISGSILIGMGVLFLLITLDVIPGWRYIWPVVIIIVGLSLIIGSLAREKKKE